MPDNLLESQLFGQSKVPSPGLSVPRAFFKERVVLIFLDEIGDMPLSAATIALCLRRSRFWQ
jgi:transcriptional regulator with PAS, ATPase and Fis domain